MKNDWYLQVFFFFKANVSQTNFKRCVYLFKRHRKRAREEAGEVKWRKRRGNGGGGREFFPLVGTFPKQPQRLGMVQARNLCQTPLFSQGL